MIAHWMGTSRSDFVLQLYLRDISSDSPRGSNPSEVSNSRCNREQLVLGHLPGVVRIAFDYQGLGLSLSDLINEGNIGLMRAAERFDPSRNVRFSYYAKPWIRVHMKRALSYQAFPVSLPADFTWRRGQVCGAEDRLSARLHREPSDAELAGACGLEEPAVRRLRSTPTPSFVSLDSPAPDAEDGLSLSEVIPDQSLPMPDEEAARHSDCEFASRLIRTLTAPEQKVIRLRFGFEDGCSRTLDEVGQILGYGRQGIHRIESVALNKLRQQARFAELRGQMSVHPKAKGRPPGTNKNGPTGAHSRRAVKDIAQSSTARPTP